MARELVTLFLCGDVMLGRGVDQILPHPGDARLREGYVRDARQYVMLAEAATGTIPYPVDFTWPWGEALTLLDEIRPDARIVNLETSVTGSDDFAPGKAVHYRMSPANVAGVSVAEPDVCVLANNHVLDFGRRGLIETLNTLATAGLSTAGAGRDEAGAWGPAVVPLPDRAARILVVSFGLPTSGIPLDWAAGPGTPGVALVRQAAMRNPHQVIDVVHSAKRDGDLVVASIHWGPNWGYDVGRDEVRLAHTLIDAGVDIVHGHSSHHPRPIEVYRGKLVLYGCGDFIDDYEGIAGHEEFRDDLRLMYVASIDPSTGALERLTMVPMQAWRMRLHPAGQEDRLWLRDMFNRINTPFGTHVELDDDGSLALLPPDVSAART